MDEWLLATPLSKLRLQQLSVGLYCIYRLTNHLRHTTKHTDTEYHQRFLNQTFNEALCDAPSLRKALRRHRVAAFAGRRRRHPAPQTAHDG